MPAPGDLIHQQSTSTGTGNFTVSAVNGKRSFNDEYGTGGTDKFDYYISNQAAAEWERGTGHLSASSTLVRDTVIASSNANVAVSFSAGLKDICNDIPAAKQVSTDGTQTLTNKTLTNPIVGTQSQGDNSTKAASTAYVDRTTREVLSANRTYYVRTDGSDSNNGLANTSGGAFLTIQKAINTASGLDLSIYDVSILVPAGTWTENLVLKSLVGAGRVTLTGDITTPSNVVLNPASGSAISADGIVGLWTVTGFKTVTSGSAIQFRVSGCAVSIGVMDWGDAAGSGGIHIYGGRGAQIQALSLVKTVSAASFGYHMFLDNNSVYYANSGTATAITGNPAFTTWVQVSNGANLRNGSETFTGSVTSGKKYNATGNASLDSGGSTFPGPTAGTTSTGGQYI